MKTYERVFSHINKRPISEHALRNIQNNIAVKQTIIEIKIMLNPVSVDS